MECNYVSEMSPSTDVLFMPQVNISMKNHGGIIFKVGRTPDSYTRALWQSYHKSSSSKAGKSSKGNDEFCLMKYLFHTSKGSLTCCKILHHGADGFTSPPKEGVLQIFITLKNPWPSPGFEPTNFGSNG
jgi:hypothetical protein